MRALKLVKADIMPRNELASNERAIYQAVRLANLKVKDLYYDDKWQKYVLTTNTAYGNLLGARMIEGLLKQLRSNINGLHDMVFDFRMTERNGGYPVLHLLCAK